MLWTRAQCRNCGSANSLDSPRGGDEPELNQFSGKFLILRRGVGLLQNLEPLPQGCIPELNATLLPPHPCKAALRLLLVFFLLSSTGSSDTSRFGSLPAFSHLSVASLLQGQERAQLRST